MGTDYDTWVLGIVEGSGEEYCDRCELEIHHQCECEEE